MKFMKKKHFLYKLLSVLIFVSIALFGTYKFIQWFQSPEQKEVRKVKRKKEKENTRNKLEVHYKTDDTGEEINTFEYGTGIIDLKDYITSEDDLKIEPETIDTSVIGETIVTITYSSVDIYGDKAARTEVETYTVKDTQPPVIKLKKDSISLKNDESFNPDDYIESVKDPVDGNLMEVTKKPTLNSEGRYDAGFYLIDSDVNTIRGGNYTVKIEAYDKNGNESEASIYVDVEKSVLEKMVEAGS